jgi:hypothetical protein
MGTPINHSIVGTRQRRWRERQKYPVRSVFQIEVESDLTLIALINTDRLSPTEIKNRDLVGRALSVVIAEWAARTNRHFRAQAISRSIVRKRRDTSAEVEARV